MDMVATAIKRLGSKSDQWLATCAFQKYPEEGKSGLAPRAAKARGNVFNHLSGLLFLFFNTQSHEKMAGTIVKRGKEVTPRRRAWIITLRSLPNPISKDKIKALIGISSSTVNDIWRHAVENARKIRHEAGLDIEEPISLVELVEEKCLDPNLRSGRPEGLTAEDKDCLVETVKKIFSSGQMKLVDIRREAGLSHEGDGTGFRTLASQGIHVYHEEFKPILGPDSKLNRTIAENEQCGGQRWSGQTTGLLMKSPLRWEQFSANHWSGGRKLKGDTTIV
ncbi:hypothetical protein B9Z19DRAFT_1123611 [Tuber borchii]|uniref:Uncharacterized protein n=1 Tax=Tuber borchii TaxID=42251 RepID=A0A2T6ZY47_TUBBO|nr:hypothetical protein B9Z19DRAFT_1123611 [Tuber borchii]